MAGAFAEEVLSGLSRRPKSISSAWLYDARGSELFQRITELDEYYLTRAEREILKAHADRLGQLFAGQRLRIIEIGAGDGSKTEILLSAFVSAGVDVEFVPIDICPQSIVSLATRLRSRFATHGFRVQGIVADCFDSWPLPSGSNGLQQLVLFLGSSIGNFDGAQSLRFLRGLCRSLQPGDCALIGFDLKKDLEALQRAYDDVAGVTREFNFNLLARINRELQGEFDSRRFTHHAAYNVEEGCMESWLVSRIDQRVPIRAVGRSFSFRAWEGIRVERSYKYDLAEIEKLAADAGFAVRGHLLDRRQRFADSLWQV